MNPSHFTRNLDELLSLARKKHNLVNHLKKNYRENVHYIVTKTANPPKKNGGQNKITFMLTEEAFEIFKNSFNMRNRYIIDGFGFNVRTIEILTPRWIKIIALFD